MIRKPLLGLALGGGGARGFAHIGVLKILEAEGIQPDIMAGTSMGGIIAALYASGMAVREIEKEAARMGDLTNMIKLLDGDFASLNHVISNDSVRDYLIRLLKDVRRFEDLRIPLALAAVDVMQARDVALQSGDLLEALSASMALPGVIEPLRKDGMRLVDGGSLNNVSADLADSMAPRWWWLWMSARRSPPCLASSMWKNWWTPAPKPR